MFAKPVITFVEGGVGVDIGAGIVLSSDLSEEMLSFLHSLAINGWLTEETVSAGFEFDADFNIKGVVVSKNGKLTDMEPAESKGMFIYSFANFEVTPAAKTASTRFIIDKFRGKVIIIEESEEFKESCSLKDLLGEPKKTVAEVIKSPPIKHERLSATTRANTAPQAIVSKPISEFQLRVKKFVEELNEGGVTFRIMGEFSSGNRVDRNVTIKPFDEYAGVNTPCVKAGRGNICNNVFCFYHPENYGERIRDNKDFFKNENKHLTAYIENMARAYDLYKKDDEKYIHFMGCAIASIPHCKEGEKMEDNKIYLVE